uniref:Uncharacterized protein n=1 Tax=Pelodiscus sinensis TaxID=13735 RepID=K7EXR7_PELSI
MDRAQPSPPPGESRLSHTGRSPASSQVRCIHPVSGRGPDTQAHTAPTLSQGGDQTRRRTQRPRSPREGTRHAGAHSAHALPGRGPDTQAHTAPTLSQGGDQTRRRTQRPRSPREGTRHAGAHSAHALPGRGPDTQAHTAPTLSQGGDQTRRRTQRPRSPREGTRHAGAHSAHALPGRGPDTQAHTAPTLSQGGDQTRRRTQRPRSPREGTRHAGAHSAHALPGRGPDTQAHTAPMLSQGGDQTQHPHATFSPWAEEEREDVPHTQKSGGRQFPDTGHLGDGRGRAEHGSRSRGGEDGRGSGRDREERVGLTPHSLAHVLEGGRGRARRGQAGLLVDPPQPLPGLRCRLPLRSSVGTAVGRSPRQLVPRRVKEHLSVWWAVGTYFGSSNGCKATSSVSGMLAGGGCFWLL